MTAPSRAKHQTSGTTRAPNFTPKPERQSRQGATERISGTCAAPTDGIAFCPCGGGCPRCAAAAAAPLPRCDVDRRLEREASDTARPFAAAPRTHQTTERAVPGNRVFPKAAPLLAASQRTAPTVVNEVLRSPGQPLDPATRAFMEPRFGHDFSHVRLHTDATAAESARAVNALAYTVGHHVAFDTGRYSPQTEAGSRLLAHELAHIGQQRRRAAAVPAQRAVSEPGDPAEREAETAADLAMRGLPVPSLVQTAAPLSRSPYWTRGTSLDHADNATLTGVSYWVRRTTDRYDLIWSARMADNPEEQAAVLAALWESNPPTAVTTPSELVVPVNTRTAPTPASAPPALLYRFKFDPPAASGGKPRLTCEFIAAGPGAIPVAAPAPAADFAPGTLRANSRGFPNGRDAYFAAHPQEFAQLMSFLDSAAPVFDRHLTTETRNTSDVLTHTSILHVARVEAAGGAATSLDVDLIGEQAPHAAVSAPADYLTRDASDYEIEKLQLASIPAADRLGTVTLPADLPATEHLAVNLAITAYFRNGAHNTEVDAIVPVGATGTATVLFTLRFGAANAVTVERIGAVGTGSGMLNTSRIDVTRISGFPGATATDAALRAWWTARYPAGGALQTPVPGPAPTTSQGTTPSPPNTTALLGEMNRLITAGIANTSWFSGNYGIELLAPTAATSRLRDVHHAPPDTHATLGTLADGTMSFSRTEMVLLELSLQTAGTTLLGALRDVKLIRMSNAITRSGRTWRSGPASTYGFTVMDGSERTVLFFDSFTHSDATLFRGGSAATALPDSTMSILHELGHAAGHQGGVETAFNAWLARHPQPAQTWYAASARSEVFPETLALFQVDPHFLCRSAPLLYAWFLEWTTTGTPPTASATLTAPTTCPP